MVTIENARQQNKSHNMQEKAFKAIRDESLENSYLTQQRIQFLWVWFRNIPYLPSSCESCYLGWTSLDWLNQQPESCAHIVMNELDTVKKLYIYVILVEGYCPTELANDEEETIAEPWDLIQIFRRSGSLSHSNISVPIAIYTCAIIIWHQAAFAFTSSDCMSLM